jgi:hypothetical protein
MHTLSCGMLGSNFEASKEERHEILHLDRRAWHPHKDQHHQPRSEPPFDPPSEHATPHCLVRNSPQGLNRTHTQLQQNQLH